MFKQDGHVSHKIFEHKLCIAQKRKVRPVNGSKAPSWDSEKSLTFVV